MKILMICGVYAEENEHEVLAHTKGYVEQSANIFQRKLIQGLDANAIEAKIISAPFIGAYPMRYKKMCFKGFIEAQARYQYVSFSNIWGIRNFSRSFSLKKAIKAYLSAEPEEEFLIFVYCAHTPFLDAAVYAKNLKPKSKIVFVVPDLPQYMNLNETGRGLYDFFKRYDIRRMERYIAKVDSFVLLTEPMKDVLKVENRPYVVVEGLVDNVDGAENTRKNDDITRIVYAGKMNVKFGIKTLVDAFTSLPNEDYRLILCGDGDAREYVEEKRRTDSRIEYQGVVSSSQVKTYINAADVLVNPRPNNEAYTKYSFPSKNIEYLMSGKPVVAYMLDGMPPCYHDFLFAVSDETVQAMRDAIEQAIRAEDHEKKNKARMAREYMCRELLCDKVVAKIIEMNV